MNPWLRAALVAGIFYWVAWRSVYFGVLIPGWKPSLDKLLRANAAKLDHHQTRIFWTLFVQWAIGGAAIIALAVAWR